MTHKLSLFFDSVLRNTQTLTLDVKRYPDNIHRTYFRFETVVATDDRVELLTMRSDPSGSYETLGTVETLYADTVEATLELAARDIDPEWFESFKDSLAVLGVRKVR